MPEGARARARIVQKQPGVVFGLAAVAETMRQCGVEDVDNLVVEGQWRDDVPAEVALASGPARGAAGGGAHRAQLPRPPLRRRDPDGALRRGGRRDRRRDPRHPQDDAGPARAGEGGGRRRRRSQPPHGPLRRDPDQGEPHRPGRRPRQGRPRRPQRPTRTCRSRSSAATSTRSPTRSAPAPTACCSTTWTPGPCARRCGCATAKPPAGRARRSRPPAASTWRPSREIAATGVDFISVGALTHSAPTLDFSLLLEPA